MELEEVIKKIEANMEQINKNSQKIEGNFANIQKNSYALEYIKDYKADSKRWFTILLVVLAMWFITIGYLVYTLNDIGTIEETTQEVTDFNTINGNITNKGDTNGQD